MNKQLQHIRDAEDALAKVRSDLEAELMERAWTWAQDETNCVIQGRLLDDLKTLTYVDSDDYVVISTPHNYVYGGFQQVRPLSVLSALKGLRDATGFYSSGDSDEDARDALLRGYKSMAAKKRNNTGAEQ